MPFTRLPPGDGGDFDVPNGQQDEFHSAIGDAVENRVAVSPRTHQTLLAQSGHVLRNGRLVKRGKRRKFADGPLARHQVADDLHSSGLREDLEKLDGGAALPDETFAVPSLESGRLTNSELGD